jgi:hypothetical protein
MRHAHYRSINTALLLPYTLSYILSIIFGICYIVIARQSLSSPVIIAIHYSLSLLDS